jgi:hypothetical protein
MARNGRPSSQDGNSERIDHGADANHAIALLSRLVVTSIYGGLPLLVDYVRRNVEDSIRFLPVAEACRQARERRGLGIREIARQLRKPQFMLIDLEDARLDRLDLRVVERYVEFLGLSPWFEDWFARNRARMHHWSAIIQPLPE